MRSALTLFRETPQVMAHRLSRTSSSGTMVQLNGDATLSNFGVYRDADGGLVFDLADFDQTHPGPWEWDLRRLATDQVVLGRTHGFTVTQRRRAVVRSARRYRDAMRVFGELSFEEVLRARADGDEVRRQHDFGRAARRATGGAARPASSLPASAGGSAGSWRPTTPAPGIPLRGRANSARDRHEALRSFLAGYAGTLVPEGRSLLADYELTDASRVVGDGATWRRCRWLLLLTSVSGDDALVLEAIQSRTCGFEEVAGLPHTSALAAERVALGRRLTQERHDPWVGWHRPDGGEAGAGGYQVHRAGPRLVSDGVARMGSFSMSEYAELCAWTLAHAHARTGDRHAIATQLASGRVFEQDLADFAEAYADQNERDHSRLRAALEDRTRRVPQSRAPRRARA